MATLLTAWKALAALLVVFAAAVKFFQQKEAQEKAEFDQKADQAASQASHAENSEDIDHALDAFSDLNHDL